MTTRFYPCTQNALENHLAPLIKGDLTIICSLPIVNEYRPLVSLLRKFGINVHAIQGNEFLYDPEVAKLILEEGSSVIGKLAGTRAEIANAFISFAKGLQGRVAVIDFHGVITSMLNQIRNQSAIQCLGVVAVGQESATNVQRLCSENKASVPILAADRILEKLNTYVNDNARLQFSTRVVRKIAETNAKHCYVLGATELGYLVSMKLKRISSVDIVESRTVFRAQALSRGFSPQQLDEVMTDAAVVIIADTFYSAPAAQMARNASCDCTLVDLTSESVDMICTLLSDHILSKVDNEETRHFKGRTTISYVPVGKIHFQKQETSHLHDLQWCGAILCLSELLRTKYGTNGALREPSNSTFESLLAIVLELWENDYVRAGTTT